MLFSRNQLIKEGMHTPVLGVFLCAFNASCNVKVRNTHRRAKFSSDALQKDALLHWIDDLLKWRHFAFCDRKRGFPVY